MSLVAPPGAAVAVPARLDPRPRPRRGGRPATVEVGTVDGRRITHHAPTRKGDPDNPLGDGELEDKVRELTAPVIGEAAAARLLETLWRVDAFDDMAELPVAGPDLAPGAQA